MKVERCGATWPWPEQDSQGDAIGGNWRGDLLPYARARRWREMGIGALTALRGDQEGETERMGLGLGLELGAAGP